jgi:mRNA interferase RelE/StbE
MKVQVAIEVRDFLRRLAPEPRRAVLAELDKVEAGKSRLMALETPLEGYYKLRAGRFRVICAIRSNTLYALFAERRSVVYEIATPELLARLLKDVQED